MKQEWENSYRREKNHFSILSFLVMHHRFVGAVVRMHCTIYLHSGLYTQFIYYVSGIIIICEGIRNIVDSFTHLLLLCASNWNAFRKWNMIVYDNWCKKIYFQRYKLLCDHTKRRLTQGRTNTKRNWNRAMNGNNDHKLRL